MNTNLLVTNGADSWWIAYPALMVNFIWFTDDKLLKFYHCSHKKCRKWSLLHTYWDSLIFTPTKNAKNDHFCTLIETVWFLHLPARQSTSTHCLRDGWVFGRVRMILALGYWVLPNPWCQHTLQSSWGTYLAFFCSTCAERNMLF